MFFKLQQPDMVQEARRTQKGSNPFLEALLFVVFFFITQVIIGVLIFLPLGVYTAFLGYTDAAGGTAADLPSLGKNLNSVILTFSLYGELIGIFLVLGLCRWIQKRKGWTLGFKKRNWLKEYGMGMGAGFLMMTAVVLAAWAIGALKLSVNPEPGTMGSSIMLLILFVGFLFQGMFEEVLCRGYFLISLARRKGNMWMAIVVSALVFGALHLGNAGISPLAFVNLVLFGVFAGIYFVKRGDLWGIGALHSLWNFAQGNIWGVAVSGIDFGPSVFRSQINEEMALLNGGSFGLEGGLLVTVLLIAGSLLLLKLPQKDAASADFPTPASGSCEIDPEPEAFQDSAEPQESTEEDEFSDAPESAEETSEADE